MIVVVLGRKAVKTGFVLELGYDSGPQSEAAVLAGMGSWGQTIGQRCRK